MGVWWTVLGGGSPPPASVLAAASSSSGAIHYLMNVPGNGGEDLLLVSLDSCVLLEGQDLAPRWTFSAPQVLRYKPGPASPSPGNPVEVDEMASVLLPAASCLPPGTSLPGAGEGGGW